MSYTYFDIGLGIFVLLLFTVLVGHYFSKPWRAYLTYRSAKRRLEGYRYAKDALLSGELTADELLELSHNPFEVDEFDLGIKQAVRDYLDALRKVEELHEQPK